MSHAVVGLSGGVDSAVTAFLCSKAFGPENVTAVRLPYSQSSESSLSDAKAVIDALGIRSLTVPITAMVDGYLAASPGPLDDLRLGNVCARCRMVVLYDVSAKEKGLVIGTSNKTERLLGYFTWHADDTPAVNPLGDLYKVQVWELARHLGVPDQIVNKPPSADLVAGQTDEDDLGVTYAQADPILSHLLNGVRPERLVKFGYEMATIQVVMKKLEGTHWKRHLPTVAMLSDTSINDYYLRPVDYRGRVTS